MSSAAPWKFQIGTSFTAGAVEGTGWPHTGTAAAKKRGRWAIMCHVPAPPIECPVT